MKELVRKMDIFKSELFSFRGSFVNICILQNRILSDYIFCVSR